MTTQSLHSIVTLENELHASELAEQKRAAHWLQTQERQILADHQARLDALAARKEGMLGKAGAEAERKAAGIIARAEERAALSAGLDDEVVKDCLDKHLVAIITGRFP